MTSVTTTLEFYDGSNWRDISGDTITGSLRWGGGILGSNPTDRVAAPGAIEFELNNSTSNSGAKLGYYSPDHANVRTGWALKAPVRVKCVSGGNTKYWRYKVKSIEPVTGLYRNRRVSVTGFDYMEEFNSQKVSGLSITSNARADTLLTALVASMPTAPLNASYDAGLYIHPYAFHDDQSDETYSITVAQKIAQSGMGYIYCDGNSTDGETLHYESPTDRYFTSASAGTLNDTMLEMTPARSMDHVYNKIKVTVKPANVDIELYIIARTAEDISVEPGLTRTIKLPYLDPDNQRRVSAADVETVTAFNGYTMSSESGTNSGDLNTDLTITQTTGANSVEFTLENTGTKKGYIALIVRGKRITLYNEVDLLSSDSTSITAYDERSLNFAMPYIASSEIGQTVADEFKRRYKDPHTRIQEIKFNANRNSTLMGYALTLGIGSRITITESVSGINSDWFINGYSYELLAGGVLNVTWIVERVFSTDTYFKLDTSTFADTTHILIPL